jgi:transcription initiation factor IIF auxiliary subunit
MASFNPHSYSQLKKNSEPTKHSKAEKALDKGADVKYQVSDHKRFDTFSWQAFPAMRAYDHVKKNSKCQALFCQKVKDLSGEYTDEVVKSV